MKQSPGNPCTNKGRLRKFFSNLLQTELVSQVDPASE